MRGEGRAEGTPEDNYGRKELLYDNEPREERGESTVDGLEDKGVTRSSTISTSSSTFSISSSFSGETEEMRLTTILKSRLLLLSKDLIHLIKEGGLLASITVSEFIQFRVMTHVTAYLRTYTVDN